MTTAYLLDTNIISAITRQNPDENAVAMYSRYRHSCYVSAATIMEIIYGIELLPIGKRRQSLEKVNLDFLEAIPSVAFDDRAARWLGVERARLKMLGRTIPAIDFMIAASSVTRQLTLATDNTKDFAGIDEVQLENWLRKQ